MAALRPSLSLSGQITRRVFRTSRGEKSIFLAALLLPNVTHTQSGKSCCAASQVFSPSTIRTGESERAPKRSSPYNGRGGGKSCKNQRSSPLSRFWQNVIGRNSLPP